MGVLEPVLHRAPHLGALVAVHELLLRLVAEVDASDLVPLLLEPVHDACAQTAFIDAHERRLVLFDGVDDVPDHFHRVRAAVPLEGDDVAPLPYGDDGGVGAEPRRVDADGDGRGLVLVLGPLHGVIDDVAGDELVVTFTGEGAVHFDVGLVAVWPVLVDDALVEVLVRPLDLARVDVARAPEVALGVERLVEVPRVAPRVGERQMEAVRRVLREEAVRH